MDQHKNFSYSLVSGISGNSLTITSGQGVLFPVPPFNATVWPAGVIPLAENAEIVRVTAIEGNVFVIARAQEGTTAKAIAAGYQIAATITAKVITDIEEAVATNTNSIQTTNSAVSGLTTEVDTLEQGLGTTNQNVSALEDAVEAKIQIVASYAAIGVSSFKRFIFVTSDEQNNGDGSLYLHTGTELKLLVTI